MKTALLNMFLSQLIAMVSPEMVKGIIEAGLEWLEKKAATTETGWDDAVVLPLTAMVRTILGMEAKKVDDPALAAPTTGGFNKYAMLSGVFTHLFESLPPEMLKGFIDAGLDVVETAVAKTETKLDDAIVLPLINLVRTSFSIPDNDPAPDVAAVAAPAAQPAA